MKDINEAVEVLKGAQRRFFKFKDIFNAFQQDILNLEAASFILKGITVKTVSETVSELSFIGKKYKIEFSVTLEGREPKGKLTFYRMHSEEEKTEISSITYKTNTQVDVESPFGEDCIMLNEDNASIMLVLNWICDDANT